MLDVNLCRASLRVGNPIYKGWVSALLISKTWEIIIPSKVFVVDAPEHVAEEEQVTQSVSSTVQLSTRSRLSF